MAGIGNSVTDELYLKLAEDKKRKKHEARDAKRNCDSFTKATTSKKHMPGNIPDNSDSNSDIKISKYFSDTTTNKAGFHRGKMHFRNRSSSRPSYDCGDPFANNTASTSRGHVPNRRHQNIEMNRYGKNEKKFISETRSASLTRNQSCHGDSKVYGIDGIDRLKPTQRSQSHSVKSYNSPHLEGNGKHRGQFARQLGYKRLQDLCNNSPTEIIAFLMSSNSGFEELLKSDLRPDLLILVVKVLAKACVCEFAVNKAALLSITCQTNLPRSIENHMFRMPTDDSIERKRTMGTFISDLLIYYETVMNVLPNTASEQFKNLFINTNIMMKSVETYHGMSLSQQKEQFSKLDEQLRNMIQERESKEIVTCSKDELLKFSAPPDDFREKSLYPTEEDLFGDETPFLRANIINGAYVDVEHYLDVQFRLLREDFVSPLREGLKELTSKNETADKKRYRVDNIRIYRNIQFGNPKVINDVIGIVVHFDPNKKFKIKWEYSKRFMFGSLLLFTNDNFEHVIFGTVLERNVEGLKNGEVIVTLHQQKLNVFESNYLMIESEVYFEPYKHVMKALQGFDESSFPMQEYIIFVQKESPPPRYLLEHPDFIYDVNDLQIQVLNDDSWPSEDALGLDKSQLASFKAALTEEFVVIQGPPGTGKTYVGLKIAKALLQNTHLWNVNKSPILVVCYTNHALDQFLEGLLSATDKIVRVGGQSKSTLLNRYNLRERRKGFNYKKANLHLKREYHTMMSQIMKSIKIMQANLEELQSHRGIISVKFLKENDIVSTQHIRCFEHSGYRDDQILNEWLMQGFEEFYGHVTEAQEDKVFDGVSRKDEDILEGGVGEDTGIWLTADEDPVLFDLGVITHDLHYATDLQALEERIRVLSSMENSSFLSGYKLEEVQDECFYLQQMLQYWKTCLKMNHRSEAAYVQRLHTSRNIWQLSTEDRWLVYKDWINTLNNKLRRTIHEYELKYRNYAKAYEEVKQICDFEIMQDALVVGMTTTNAARLQNLLQALKPKIVIVEEAAEVLESHIVVSLTNKCQHVILIGDHKQLRPNPAVYKLARRFHFDISLFERMINNGLPCYCLENQHRMRPEIAQLIVPTIYPDLKNDLSVYNYSTVRGITKSVFFLTHDVHEEEVDEIKSHQNGYEGDFILALCRHLIWQGYKPEEITILATYKGQMFYMKQKQKRLAISSEVHITAVDNYQGEENKIILLSLVRSNADAKIGFLSIENRVCVALSRAKEGLYIIGNMDNLVQSSVIWTKIKESLVKQESFGSHLTLQCEIHPDQKTLVNCAVDFKKVPEGGCSLLCEVQLQCGHQCESVCHVNNREHKEYKCHKKCERVPPECELNHPCKKRCFETCGQCETPVERTLPCGHIKSLPCHVNIKEYHCLESVEVELPNCGHKVTKRCYQDTATYPCSVPCPDRLPCGHSCTLKCHAVMDPDHLEYKCGKRCAKTNAGCTMNHICTKLCYEECGLCSFEVEKKLLHCNHSQRMKCSEDPGNIECKKKCSKTMLCGHPCHRKCFENCGGCQVKVKKVIPSCDHEITVKCCETPIQSLCKRPCQRLLPCGHGCVRRCGQMCAEECHELVRCPVTPLCGHGINIPCYLKKSATPKSQLLLRFCEVPCGKILACEHMCTGTCGECMQGRIHIACAEKCDRNLICGHKCKVPCAASCPPCSAKCQYRCKHSRCNKKCGVPCVPCKERCDWKCEHLQCTKLCHELCDREPCYEPCKKKLKCGHNCIGFCGDMCPPLCRICNKEEVTEVFFGTEDDENARFVYLVDCKHTIESKGLEKWLQQSDDQITQKTCPRCKSSIMRTERYMNLLKLTIMDIAQVKRKNFGEMNKLEKERQILSRKLVELHGSSLQLKLKLSSKMYSEMLKMCQDQLNQVKNNRHNHLSRGDLQSMKSQIDIFNDLVSSISICIIKPNITLKTEVKDKLFYQFDLMLEKIKQRHGKFSAQETADFNKECKRFFRATQLAVLESSPNFSSSQTQVAVKTLYEKACSIMQSIDIYTDDKHTEFKSILDNLQKYVGNISLTERERKEIVQAMGLSQGHWFKCPNGHIYCIDACGGAMQTSQCPDCGAAIGGSSHRLLATNRLASEMDGAVRPAWPGGLY